MTSRVTPTASSRGGATVVVGRHRAAAEATTLRRGRSLWSTLGLTALAVVLPGSSMWVLGRRKLGIALLLAYLALAGTVTYLVIAERPAVLRLLVQPTWLNVTIAGLVIGFLMWALVVVLTHVMARPPGLRRGQRLGATFFVAVLCGALAIPFVVAVRYASAQKGFITDVFPSGSHSATRPTDATAANPWRGQDRVNVLLLGSDAGPDREGIRTDSMIVASVDVSSGNVVLFSLPRNLENVPFPEGTVMAEQFPDGFNCDGCYLNGVYTWAVDNAELFPGVDDPGVLATKQAVEGVTGLPINYYAMVNLQGFQDLVDAVGGVTINVPKQIPIGGIGAEISGYVPAGVHKLNGFQTLWFARSRVADDDYSRMARQKCVMSAMLQQLSPRTVLTRAEDIAAASKRLLRTDLPASELDTFIDLALKARSQPVASVSFVPPAVQTYDPDFALIRSMVVDALVKSEGGSREDAGPRKRKGAKAANETDDLARAC